MLPLPLILNVIQTIAVEDRTEVRARAVESEALVDVETDPQLKYKAEWRNGLDSLSLSYSPRIVLTNIGGTPPTAAAVPGIAPEEKAINDALPQNPTPQERAAAAAQIADLRRLRNEAVAAAQAAAEQGSTVNKVDFIHRFGGVFQWRLGPRTNFSTNGTVSYGIANLSTILIQPRWNGEDRPAPPLPFPKLLAARLEVLATYSAAQIYHQVTPRLSIQPGFVFITYGAPTFEGRKVQPYLENPAARFELNYEVTPRDDFAIDIQPQFNVFTGSTQLPLCTPAKNDPSQVTHPDCFSNRASGKTVVRQRDNFNAAGNFVGQPQRFESREAPILYQGYAEARLKHRFSELVSGEIAGGTSLTAQDRSIDPNDLYNVRQLPTALVTNVYPVAEVALIAAFRSGSSARGRFYGYARLNPWLNPLSGEILRRIDYVGAFSLTFGLNAIRAQGALANTLPDQQEAFRQITGELSYERRLSTSWSVDIGGRVGYQDLVSVDGATNTEKSLSTFQPGGYVGLSYRPLPLKL